MSKAYYWYRPHPYFGEFYPGKVLNLISDTKIFYKYFSDRENIKLIKKYFPHGLTPHGLSMLLDYKINDLNVIEPITDMIFESIRQLHFPDAHSRLSSLYASESIKQALLWKPYLQTDGQAVDSLWEIEFQTDARLYDAVFLNIVPDDVFSYLFAIENAHKYWCGEFSDQPLPELLIPYPAVVTCRISDTDIMAI